MADDGEIDVKKVDQQVTSGIAARFNEMHDPIEVDHYHYATDRSLIVSKTDEENGVDDSLIITTERGAAPGHPGRETVTTTIYHEQRDQKTNKTATLDRVVLVTPDMPEGAGEEQPFGKITSQGFRDLLENPKTEVDMAKSYDPNADGSDQTTYTEIKRTTSGQGEPTFLIQEASQSSNGSDRNYTWQPRKPEDTSRVIRYWCL